MSTRRNFLCSTSVQLLCISACGSAFAQAAKLEETDATAKALGYVHDAAKAEAAKAPGFVSGRNCANCLLFQGKPADALAACGAFAGKQVNAKGWCVAWAKKA